MLFTWSRLKGIIFILLIIAVVAAIVSFNGNFYSVLTKVFPFLPSITEQSKDNFKPDGNLQIVTAEKEVDLNVEFSRTVDEITTGLKYRDSICETCGILFFFENDSQTGFYMKDCKFPLDMMFVDADMNIVDIKKSFETCTDVCTPYYSKVPYRYVIEVNGGWCDRNSVNIGDKVNFNF